MPITRSFASIVLLCGLSAGALGACSGGPKPPAKAASDGPASGAASPAAPGRSGKPGGGGPAVSQDVGALDKTAVDAQFEVLKRRAEKCQDDRRVQVEKLDFVSGTLEFEVRIGEDGKVRALLAPHSTVGDRVVEKCILEAARSLAWPRPEGGREGIARSTFSLPMKADRDAVAWEPSKAAEAASKARSAVQACRAGKPGAVEITAYVDTDGKVLAAGVSMPDASYADGADCVFDAIRGVKFPSPGGWPAKVTFTIQ
jgi:hypothetical protein